MSNLSDLLNRLDELKLQKEQGQNVQKEIDRVSREILEERARKEALWGETDENTANETQAKAGDKLPGQHLPARRR